MNELLAKEKRQMFALYGRHFKRKYIWEEKKYSDNYK